MRSFPVSVLLLVAACGGPPDKTWTCELTVLDETRVVDARDVTLYRQVEGECSSPYAPRSSSRP